MGMGDAFMDGKGNFPGLLELNESEYARISSVVHAARLTVDEEGTKASAATSVEVSVTGILMPPEDAFEMRCDRPFAMQIIHADTGAVMFTAVINDLNG
jgi:serpin B